jgi:uncharacterized membrane protein
MSARGNAARGRRGRRQVTARTQAHGAKFASAAQTRTASGTPAVSTRIVAIDALRGLAIIAMIAYHIAFDLNWFGIFSADFNREPLWLTLRALIVSSFLVLVGIGLVLAQRADTTPARFWRRIALIAFCAALVSAVSYVVFPRSFVTFGILHCIALSSVLAWPLVRIPWAALVIGLVAIALGLQLQVPAFDSAWLNWVGLMTHKPATEDYVPLLPWFGVVCVGVTVGNVLAARNFSPLRFVDDAAPAWLTWVGRHSLLVYMVHQPIILGILRVVLPR